MNVAITDVNFVFYSELSSSCDVSYHVGILPNCHACPDGKTPQTCEELCEAYEIEVSKLEVGSVGFVQPEPVMDIISANRLSGVDPSVMLGCPSPLSVLDDQIVADHRFLSRENRDEILDILQLEIDTGGTILTHRQFEVLYLTYVEGRQPSEIAPLLSNNDEMYNLENSYKAGNISEEEYRIKKNNIDCQPQKTVTSQTVLFHLRRAEIKMAKASGLREERKPVFELQKIKCAYVNCETIFTPIDKNQKFCDPKCRRAQKNRFKYKKKKAEADLEETDDGKVLTCANPKCNAPFVPHDAVQKYCNIKCRKRHYNVKYKISKKKKISDLFEPVSRRGEAPSQIAISFLIIVS